jgi:hypothetical protein
VRLLVATVSTVSCGKKALLLKVAQRGLASIYGDIDAPATPTVASVWSTTRYVRLTPHRGGAIASSPSGEMKLYNVKKHVPYGRKRAGL